MLTGLLLAAAIAVTAPTSAASPPNATVLANRTAFNQPCVWFNSTAPDRLAAGASAALQRLGWVHPGALAGDEELLSTPRQLAWRARGALADGRPLEVHLDAAQLTLLGWDWVR